MNIYVRVRLSAGVLESDMCVRMRGYLKLRVCARTYVCVCARQFSARVCEINEEQYIFRIPPCRVFDKCPKDTLTWCIWDLL